MLQLGESNTQELLCELSFSSIILCTSHLHQSLLVKRSGTALFSDL